MDLRPTYTVTELTLRWRCSKDTLYNLIKNKEITGFKVGRDWRITAESVDRYETTH